MQDSLSVWTVINFLAILVKYLYTALSLSTSTWTESANPNTTRYSAI
jgi:hypothetical protein